MLFLLCVVVPYIAISIMFSFWGMVCPFPHAFLSFTLFVLGFRIMASMLCTQCMPLLLISLLSPICLLPKRPFGTKMIFMHKSSTLKATNPSVISDSFNIIYYFCNAKLVNLTK